MFLREIQANSIGWDNKTHKGPKWEKNLCLYVYMHAYTSLYIYIDEQK